MKKEFSDELEVVEQKQISEMVFEIDSLLNEPPVFVTSTVISIDMTFSEIIHNLSTILLAIAPGKWRRALMTLKEIAIYANKHLYSKNNKHRLVGPIRMIKHGRIISKMILHLFWLTISKNKKSGLSKNFRIKNFNNFSLN